MKLYYNTKVKGKTVTVFRRDVYLYSFLFVMIGVFLMLSVVNYIPTTISNTYTAMFITNNTEVYNLALNITKNCNDTFLNEWCISNSINQWVFNNIEYTGTERRLLDEKVEVTLSRRGGVCRHKTALSCSMIESLGLNCRVNTYRNIRNNEHKQHAWFEVDVNDGYTEYVIVCDPTNNKYCDFMTLSRYIEKFNKPVFG